MKSVYLATLFCIGAVTVGSAPAMAGCNACNIQTKVAAPGAAGMFVYRITCIDDSSGDEITSNITAANDDDALKAAAAKCN